MDSNKYISVTAFHLTIIFMAVVLSRIAYILSPVGQTGGADEAVFGLMAQQILALKEWPIYCWEAHYAGAVVSYIAALIFKFWGSGFVQLRLAMFPIVVATPMIFYFIYRQIFDPMCAFVGSLFLIFCPYVVFYYTFSAHGGYGETFLGSALIIWLSWHITQQKDPDCATKKYAVLGFLCGFFFYILFLIMPVIFAFALPTLLPLSRNKKRIAAFLSGGIVGLLPFIAYNVFYNGKTFLRSAGRGLDVGREAIQMPLPDLVISIVYKKMTYLSQWAYEAPTIFGQYLVPNYMGPHIRTAAGVLLIACILFFILQPLRKSLLLEDQLDKIIQFKRFFILLIFFIWIANLNRARHLLPIAFGIPVILFCISKSRRHLTVMVTAIICLISLANIYDLLRHMQQPHFDPGPVVKMMRQYDIELFYGSYWTVYPIMFEAEGQMQGAPYLLKPNEVLSDRRAIASELVKRSSHPAFVFSSSEIGLQKRFETFLRSNDITSEKIAVSNANIFYKLSKSVHVVADSYNGSNFIIRAI